MKRRHLEKAIILGLLAASISVPVWAKDTISGPLWADANKTVEEGNLIVDAGKTVGIGFQGTVNVKNGNLTVNSDSNGILAGYDKDSTVNILANNITINSGENGIFTIWGDGLGDLFKGYSGHVNIGSSDRKVDSLYINAGGQGIDNKRGSVTIYGSQDSIISIKTDSTGGEMENQDGILNESGQVVIEGGNVIVSADYGYGINNNSTKVDIDAAGSVSIVSKDIPIDGKDPIVNAGINNTTGITEITAEKGIFIDSTHDGINATGGTVTLTGGLINKIDAVNSGIYATGKNTKVNLNADSNIINVTNDDGGATGIWVANGATEEIVSQNGNVRIEVDGSKASHGVLVENSTAKIEAHNGSTIINASTSYYNQAYGIWVKDEKNTNSSVNVNSKISNIIYGDQSAVFTSGNNASANVISDIGSNFLSGKVYAIAADKASNMNIESKHGSNLIVSELSSGVYNYGGLDVNLTANNGYNIIESNGDNSYGIYVRKENARVDLNAIDNEISADNGILAWEKGTAELNASNINQINSNGYGVLAINDSTVNLTAKNNQIKAAVDKDGYGSGHAIQASDQSQVNLHATANDNVLAGVIYAKDDGTNVTLDHNIMDDNGDIVEKGSGSNYIYSSAHGSEAEGRNHVVAALYAQNQGQIDIVAGEGGINYIETSYTDLDDSETSTDSERTIWAQQGGVIQIKGITVIKSSNAEDFYEGGYAMNSRGVAITAGTGIDLDDPDHGYKGNDGKMHAFYENGVLADVDEVLGRRSTVNLEYGAGSAIYGDIVSGYGGFINIKKAVNDGEYGIDIQGNALAANGGKLIIDLGKGGTWYGRADDYGDAGYGEEAKDKQNFYNPVFSDTIYTGGTVDIKMGEGSKWYLTGQSWVSSLDVTESKGNVTIDMERFNEGTHGLTISELKGETGNGVDATFVMDLDHNSHSTSDMLYIKKATGEYDVVLNGVIDGMDKICEDNVLRFATVQGGASFNSVTMKDAGLYNLGFEIDHSEYDTSAEEENKGYNDSGINAEGGYDTVGTNKPGNENVEGFFDLNKNSEDNTRDIMMVNETDAAADNPDSVQNWYITKVSGQDISDGGKTVVNMSKVNYSNAVYMDRLNKRLGEARYINTEEDQGMWVRMRHDRIGKDNEFRIMNTMYELGYDEKQECDNGERRVGAAIDYMDGSSEYTGVGGSGDVSRKGIWLYDTWLGDKGHYSDFVAKWGHLSNDFTLYRGGDKITGDFSNNVYSISAEYGRKKDIGNNWYFEPQVQLQYARVTDANYTTSQGTEVSLDAINSLIARAGFRLGKDLGERSTVYFKADLLHEFLGDQDIYATDGTGTMDVTYGNEGTWCDIGFGFATAMSKTSYAYLDVETSLGNDYEETYQINAGLQWSF